MNFILRYTGAGKPDLKKITAVLNLHEIEIVDDSLLPKSALVKIDPAKMEQLKGGLDGDWDIIPEKSYKVPDTKKKIRKP